MILSYTHLSFTLMSSVNDGLGLSVQISGQFGRVVFNWWLYSI